jgi:formylglycine-generating enzyme required for sulfatase activity
MKKIDVILSAPRPAELPRPKVEQDKLDVDVMRKRDRLFSEIAKGHGKSGQSFRDCAECAEMVVIPAGSFEMGTPEKFGNDAEKPAHQVNMEKPFAMGKTEVTQQQWFAVMGNDPSHFASCGDTCPVENVNWNDAQEFIKRLNARTGKQYRLPSEAEWEYACRAGGKMEYCGSDEVDNVAWNGSNSGNTTHPAARKQANAFGLYDMNGNVWEWLEDSWHNNYVGAPAEGVVWQGDGVQRIMRGGSWGDVSQGTRAAIRVGLVPSIRINSNGFRLVRELP